THIMEGSAKMLVLAVGEHSQTGMIFKLLGATKEDDEEKTVKNKKENANGLVDGEANERLVAPESIAGAQGNNHEATELLNVEIAKEKDTAGDDDSGGFKVKERSILQAKLTKLAIQIGYAELRDETFGLNLYS
ncbi:unnamed protein product, partial [Rotaria magnacalcarata]